MQVCSHFNPLDYFIRQRVYDDNLVVNFHPPFLAVPFIGSHLRNLEKRHFVLAHFPWRWPSPKRLLLSGATWTLWGIKPIFIPASPNRGRAADFRRKVNSFYDRPIFGANNRYFPCFFHRHIDFVFNFNFRIFWRFFALAG